MMRAPLPFVLAALLTSAYACASAPPRRPASASRTPLVVILVVDQMRGSYLEAFGGGFTAGLKRLMTEGTWFRRAAYPYLNTVTCAGHSTIGTGALPYTHGMVLNGWWDRETARARGCTADPTVVNLGYSGTAAGGESARTLRVAPLAQQLVSENGGRSVALSLKPRSAIPMVGTNPTAVVWFDDRAGWTTSTAFTREPVEWMSRFFAAHPFGNDLGNAWDRLLPAASYRGQDAGAGERPPTGWTASFPHPIGEPREQFQTQWQRSPLSDEYLARMAVHAVDTLDLGRGRGVDFLSVSFSALDLVGHQFGPESHEVQDVLFRLDRTIGRLLDHLDARVGREHYVLALSADHGVAALPEQTGGRRQPSAEVVATIDAALAPFFGPGKYVAHTAYTDVYLAPGVFEKVTATPAASQALLDALRAMPGIAHAFRSDDVNQAGARQSPDPVLRAAALSYFPGRSGDILIVPEENWLLSSAATTHGTLYRYDQHVPVIFFGAGVPASVSDAPATPADIAPTLAELAGARFRRRDGVSLLQRR